MKNPASAGFFYIVLRKDPRVIYWRNPDPE